MINELLDRVLKNKQVYEVETRFGHICVVTDRVEYNLPNQVFPLHPENRFYLDEIVEEKIKGANVLEIGVGSGVLSIGAVMAGAEEVTALEINPRAKNYAGFNIVLNGLEDKIEIRDGDEKDIFKPIEGKNFDYIISNPPFEPTPSGSKNTYVHSDGGIYGLDFVEKIFSDLDNYLTNDGHAQIVTFAPGNEERPVMLRSLVKKHLNGQTTIKVNPISMRFDDFVDRFVEIGQATEQQVAETKKQAAQDGISHLYLCMIHYEKGPEQIEIIPTEKRYRNWDLPLNSAVPMGYKGESK